MRGGLSLAGSKKKDRSAAPFNFTSGAALGTETVCAGAAYLK
jgi:hypothetical protein